MFDPTPFLALVAIFAAAPLGHWLSKWNEKRRPRVPKPLKRRV